MAMAIAQDRFGNQHKCDSAAGKFEAGKFVSNKNVAQKAVVAVSKLNRAKTKSLVGYKPKPLTKELVAWADIVFFFGAQFRMDARYRFPWGNTLAEFYLGNDQGTDVPDPFDGHPWFDGKDHPGKGGAKQEHYDMVAKAMAEIYQPALENRY